MALIYWVRAPAPANPVAGLSESLVDSKETGKCAHRGRIPFPALILNPIRYGLIVYVLCRPSCGVHDTLVQFYRGYFSCDTSPECGYHVRKRMSPPRLSGCPTSIGGFLTLNYRKVVVRWYWR